VEIQAAEEVMCKCGSTDFERNLRCVGTWKEFITVKDGIVTHQEATTDDLKLGKQPKTIRCIECGKRCPNPDFKKSR
jgi:hypothetical protein